MSKKSDVLSAGVEVKNSSFDDIVDGKPVGWNIKGERIRAEAGAGCNGSPGVVWESSEPLEVQSGVVQDLTGWETGVEYEFSAQVRTENFKTPSYKGVCVCVEWRDANGKYISGGYVSRGRLPLEGWNTIRGTTRQVPTNTARMSVYVFVGPGSTGKVHMDEVVVRPLLLPPVEYVCSDVYRNVAVEGKVKFSASLHVPKAVRGVAKTVFRHRGADGGIRETPGTGMTDREAFLYLDVADLAMGAHDVECELSANGKVLGSAALKFTRAAGLPKRRVWIDRYNRCILDGKPFFPLGMYFGTVTPAALAVYTNGPFNCVMPYPVTREKQLDLCRKAGLMSFVSFQGVIEGSKNARKYGFSTPAKVDAFYSNRVDRLRGHPAVIGWYLFDEPPQSTIPSYRRVYDLIGRVDRDHPIWGVYHRESVIREYLPICDVIGIDVYPIPVRHAGSLTGRLRNTRKEVFGNRVMWNVPQTFNWKRKNVPGDRFPTEDELRSMYWQHIVDGSTGLIGYSFQAMLNDRDEFDRNWSALCRVATEVRDQIPVILSVEPVPGLKCSSADIVCRGWMKNGELHVVVCNLATDSVEASVSIGGGGWKIAGVLLWNSVEMPDPGTVSVKMPKDGVTLVRLRPAVDVR